MKEDDKEIPMDVSDLGPPLMTPATYDRNKFFRTWGEVVRFWLLVAAAFALAWWSDLFFWLKP